MCEFRRNFIGIKANKTYYVHIADDEVTILADMNGQVVEVGGVINVEPVYTVDGDVNL